MEFTEHSIVFGKSCFNCDSCDVDTETLLYWCKREKRVIMKRIAAINSFCRDWAIKEEEG